MSGWIKIHRKIVDSPDYFAEPFTRTQAWVDLILTANFRESYIRVKGTRVKVAPGEIITSSTRLAERWQWSRGKVLRYLDELETEQQIVQVRTAVYTSISIINYAKYQADSTSDDTDYDTADGTSADTSEEEYKKEKKNINTHTVDSFKGGVGGNPEVEEDQAYKLVAWLNTEHPALAAKQRPLTVEQAGWLLKKHSPATLRRILSQMADDPRTSQKEDVYCRMVTFLRWDKQEAKEVKRRYTYDDLCNEMQKGTPMEWFEKVEVPNGRPYWVKREDVA